MLVSMGCGDDCLYIPGLRRDDWPLPDPKAKTINEVRTIRDDIQGRVAELLKPSTVACSTVACRVACIL